MSLTTGQSLSAADEPGLAADQRHPIITAALCRGLMRRLALGLLLRLHSSLSHRARASAPTPPSCTSRTSARSAADAAGLGAAVGGRASAAAGSASLDSSSAAAARPALLFFFLDFFEPSSSSFVALGRAAPPYIGERSYIIAASCIACGGTTAAGCGGATCCRVGSAVGFSVPRRAVPLFSSIARCWSTVRVPFECGRESALRDRSTRDLEGQ